MKKNDNVNQAKKYILVLLMIFCSGTVAFNIQYNSIIVPTFAGIAIITGIVQGKISKTVYDAIVILFIIYMNMFIHVKHNVAINGILQISLYVIGTYFTVSTMTFLEYKTIFVKTVEILTVIAIGVFACVNIGIIPHTMKIVNGSAYQFALFHVVGWEETVFRNRMCGLFHEPGMFQIILNVALIYVVDDIVLYGRRKRDLFRTSLLVIAILLTRSTTGYIVMCLVLGILYFRYWKNIKGRSKKFLYGLILPVIAACGYYVLRSEVVVNKFTQTNISYMIRTNDLISGVNMIAGKAFLGYGYNSELYNNVSQLHNMDGISNGFIGTTIMFGIPAMIVFIYYLIQNNSRKRWVIPTYIIILFFIFEQMAESSFFFPISLAFLLRFKGEECRYKKEKMMI